MIGQSPDPLPNLFILGAPKAGTTALHGLLAEHPQIFMTPVKEPAFFSSDRQYARGVHYYRSTFYRGSETYPVRGEATPWYLYPPTTPHRITATLDRNSARFIVLLRDPVARAYSMYLDRYQIYAQSRSFEDSVAADLAENEPTESGDQADYLDRYVLTSRYAEPLRRYFEVFGRDSFLVLFSEDLRVAQAATLYRILSFLGVNTDWSPNAASSRANSSGVPRSRTLRRVVTAIDSSSTVRAVGSRVVPARLYRPVFQLINRHNRKSRKAPPLDQATDRWLRQVLASDVGRLEDLLECDLSRWLP